MTTKTCGCTTETCGCCEGIQVLTPQSTVNRPGLGALRYRVGTHGAFLETMKARLSTMTVDLPGADGITLEPFAPLLGLTTRDTSDFSIALLDGWATVADVLTFYQERIANEGFLRTATERRSILELARLLGYKLRPGVAATVYLAYTIDENQTTPAQIPVGARSQSIPGPGELPQSFETSDPLEARAEWNNLQVRLTRPQNITLANALGIENTYVAGANTNLKAGDSLLLVFGDDGNPSVLRVVQSVEGQFEQKQTLIQFQPVAPDVVAAVPLLADFVTAAKKLLTANSSGASRRLVEKADEILTQSYLNLSTVPADWVGTILNAADGTPEPAIGEAFLDFEQKVADVLEKLPSPSPEVVVTDPSKFVTPLLLAQKIQAANSLQLPRSLSGAFKPGTDANPQLLVRFAPRLKNFFYTAWGNANVNATPPMLKGIFALHVEASLFGANAPKEVNYDYDKNKPLAPSEWALDGESSDALFLDQAYETIQPASYVLVQEDSGARSVKLVESAQTVQRTAYGISGKTTRLAFADEWRTANEWDKLDVLRPVLVRGQSEALALVETPIHDDVLLTDDDMKAEKGIELAELQNELVSGRWVILSGVRTDIPGVTGVKASELLMISSLRQDFDSRLPGDKTRTTLLIATPTAYSYKRDTVKLYGNVVKATHGETRNETLGNGDGSQSLQSFTLKQPPLTFVPAPNPTGVDSTLEVFVNNVQWHEADTLAGLGPKDRKFITKTDDDDKSTVIFGNGKQGARLPTGMANVTSIYRNGIGKPGNVKAEQISLLQTRPLGAKSVINPLPASGGADKENRDQARENAPLAVMSLDRLVSVQDYADFVRTFAGIGKAAARRLSDTQRRLVHVTIAGADDIPIDATSDLYQNLLIALRKFGDPDLPVQVQLRELVVLVLNANVRLAADYQWEPVATEIRATLLDVFGFQKRALGQPTLLSEVISAIQATQGVEYVDVDAFGGVPEKKPEVDDKGKPTGQRTLLTLTDIAAVVNQIVNPQQASILARYARPAEPVPAKRVAANLADFESGALRPAQLAVFTDAVSDTLILNQIK
ncbi:MAG: putative baseplate assembly protein [Candidatus Udaeobacter sp.]